MAAIYSVKELFYTLQGEGAHAGRPAVFLRFAGCNLWTGREQDRASAICPFCDTDFVGTDGPGGGRFRGAEELAAAVRAAWPQDEAGQPLGRPYVVCTGGEPLLQLDTEAVAALRGQGFEVAIETNGTQPLPPGGVDWVCLSPKAGAALQLVQADELKLVVPQQALLPEALPAEIVATHRFLQPMDVPGDEARTQANAAWAVEYCLAHPQWRLSVQTHKTLGIA